MPSPLPGMDPFIEFQAWPNFHVGMIVCIQERLTQVVRPRYVVRSEERVYLEHVHDERPGYYRPDVAIARAEADHVAGATSGASVVAEPVVLSVPIPGKEIEHYLTIQDRETMEVVTIIELLSPGNKRRGSDGRREYINKRESVLRTRTNLVELDLLMSGERLPTIGTLPLADYFAFVCRGTCRPDAEVFPWFVEDEMPTIPIPLGVADADVQIDLQAAFNVVYDRAGYDYSLHYDDEGLRLNDETSARVLSLIKANS